jgi:hypothetical protein
LERTQQHVLNDIPNAGFLRVRHSKLPLDFKALAVVENAMENRPMDAVVIGYAGSMPDAAKAVRDSLHPEEGDINHSVADLSAALRLRPYTRQRQGSPQRP